MASPAAVSSLLRHTFFHSSLAYSSTLPDESEEVGVFGEEVGVSASGANLTCPLYGEVVLAVKGRGREGKGENTKHWQLKPVNNWETDK